MNNAHQWSFLFLEERIHRSSFLSFDVSFTFILMSLSRTSSSTATGCITAETVWKQETKKRHTSINCLMNLLHLLMLQMLFPKDQIDILSQHSMQISTEVHKVTYTIENSIQWQVISKWMQFYFFVRDKDRSCLRTRKTAKLNNGFSHWKQSLINFATLRTILSIFLTRLICCLST